MRRLLRWSVDRGRRRRRGRVIGLFQCGLEWLGVKRRFFRTLRPYPTYKWNGKENKRVNSPTPAKYQVVRRTTLTGWRYASFAIAIVDALFWNVVVLEVGEIVPDARQKVG